MVVCSLDVDLIVSQEATSTDLHYIPFIPDNQHTVETRRRNPGAAQNSQRAILLRNPTDFSDSYGKPLIIECMQLDPA